MAIMSEREGKRGGEGVWDTWEKGLQRPREAGKASGRTSGQHDGLPRGSEGSQDLPKTIGKNYRKINYMKNYRKKISLEIQEKLLRPSNCRSDFKN